METFEFLFIIIIIIIIFVGHSKEQLAYRLDSVSSYTFYPTYLFGMHL